MNSLHRVLAGGRVRERPLLDTVGVGLVEVTVAMGLMGVVVAGVMGVINMQQKATQNSTQNTQSNMIIQHIASLLGDPARCADALKVNDASALFPMGALGNNPITIPTDKMNRIVANGFDSSSSNWIEIAEVGTVIRGLRLASITAVPQGPYEPLTPTSGVRQFEMRFEFRPDTSGPERSLGSQVFTRGIGLRVTTLNTTTPPEGHPNDGDRWRTIERCSVFQDNGQAACEAMGYTWEQGNNPPCRAGAGVFVNNVGSRASVMAQILSGDGTLNSGIGTDDNIYAGRNIRAAQDVIAERSIAATNGTDGWAALNATGVQNGYNHPHLQFFRAQGTLAARANIGTGNNGIIGAIYGSGFHGGGNRQSAMMRFINRDTWAANSYPSTWELFVARPGWNSWFQFDDPGSLNELTYSPTGTPMPALRVSPNQSLEVGNEIHFGKYRRRTVGAAADLHAADAGVLPGGYVAVDANDIEFGSQDPKIRHIAFYHRGLANAYHMDTSQGQVRSIGSKNLAHPKKPEFALLSEDGTSFFNHPAVLREADSGEYYGPAEFIIRKGGANLSQTQVRLLINGNALGAPEPGMVLSSTDTSGTVAWDWPSGSTRIDASPDSAPWYLAHVFSGGTGSWRVVATFTSSTIGTWCMRTQVTFQWRVGSGAWNNVGTKTLVTARDNDDDRASENWTRDVLIPSVAVGETLQMQILASGSCAISSLANSIKLIAVKQ